MHLLFVNGHLKTGGVEKSLVDLLNSIDYSIHSVDLLLFEDLGEYASQVPKEVNIVLCDLKPTYGALVNVVKASIRNKDLKNIYMKFVLLLSSRLGVKWFKLFKLLKITPIKYDCAIAYRVGICTEYVGLVAKANKKYMWWHHGEFDYPPQIVSRWCKTLNYIDKIVCVSESTKKLIVHKLNKSEENIEVIPNIIFPDKIKANAKINNPYGYKDKTILVSVGRMSPEKCMINTVYAMEKLIRRGYSSIEWYLIGDGQERVNIENEIRKRNLSNKIFCIGNKSNPYPYIEYADIFVHPSFVESQGITVLEAFALEKPCVVTRNIGTEEYVLDGENALMAEQSIESLVDKIEKMLDGNIGETFSPKCQQETLRQFSSDTIVKKVMTLFEK